jgi:hypothetical protein
MDKKLDFEKEVNSLLQLENEDLYFIIGEDLIGITTGLLKPPREELIKRAKEWFEKNRRPIQDKICRSKTLQYYLFENNKYDKLITISSLFDLILSMKLNISPIVVSILVFREGIKSFCSDYLIL